MDTKVVEKCQISPSHGGAAEQSLPLVYFDMQSLHLYIETLLSYNFPSSNQHFFKTILPNLKNSLSLALKHFLPLAGKIIFPLNSSGMPVSRYSSGDEDSVSFTVSVSDSNFFLLTGNQPKDADVFHFLVPEIPPAVYSSDSIKFPVIALKITWFPKQGICIGITCHHAICDGAALVCFLQTWASIIKFNDDKHLLASGRKFLPVYDRTAVEDSDKLTPLLWEMMKNSTPAVSSAISFPTQKLRGTFLLRDEQVLKLKNFLMLKKPGTAHVSSNTAVLARVWSCLAVAAGEEVSDDEIEYLLMPVDCRARLRPPLPSTYFGNCLTFVLAEPAHGRLRGNGGFVAAAEAIGEALDKTLENEKGILDGCIERYLRILELYGQGKRMVAVTGSTGFDLYGSDNGWGAIKKLEILNFHMDGCFSLCKSMEGVEVGINLPKLKMDAFAAFFNTNVYDMQGSKL